MISQLLPLGLKPVPLQTNIPFSGCCCLSILYALHVDDNRKISVSNDPGHEKQTFFSLYGFSLSLTLVPLVHFAKDFYFSAKLYSSVTLLFIGVACSQFVTNRKSSC